MKSRAARSERGFSVIEMMVVAAIMSGITAVMYSAFALQSDTMLRERGNAVTQNQLRTVVDRMVREIQSAGFDPAESNAFGLLEAETDAIRFTTDASRDGTLQAGVDENRGFALVGQSLMAWLGGDPALTTSWRELIGGVQQLEFEYLDVNGQPTTLLPAIRQAHITLRVRSQGRSPRVGYAFMSHTARAFLRNLD